MSAEVLDLDEARALLQVKITQLEMVRDRGIDLSEDDEESFLQYDPIAENHVKAFIKYYKNTPNEDYAFVVKQSGSGSKKEVSFRNKLSRIYKYDDGSILPVIYISQGSNDTEKKIGKQTVCEAMISLRENLAGEVKGKSEDTGCDFLKNIDKNDPLTAIKTLVFISSTDFGPQAIEGLKANTMFMIQIFLDETLMYNPTKHILYQQHIALTEKETKEFIEKNKDRIKANQIPKLKFVNRFSPKLKTATGETDPIVKYFAFEPGQIIRIIRQNLVIEILAEESETYRIVSL